jgi:hypothetical protein
MSMNMYELLPDDLKEDMRTYDSFPELRIAIPCRMAIIAGSGKGKTQCLVNHLFRMSCFKRYFIVVKKHNEKMITWLKRVIEAQQQRDPEVEIVEGTDLRDLPNINTLDPEDSRNTAVILDDQIVDRDQSNAMEYMIRGRSMHCSIFYISQKFLGKEGIPVLVRRQLTHVCMLELDSLAEVKRILNEFGEAKELMPRYLEIVKKPFNWMCFDLESRHPSLKVRDAYGNMEENAKLPLHYEEPKLIEAPKKSDGLAIPKLRRSKK